MAAVVDTERRRAAQEQARALAAQERRIASEKEALVQSLQRRGMPGAAGGADGYRVLRSAMDRLAVAYDAAHGGLSERSEQETLDALGALDLKSSDLRVHRQAERLSYAISLRMVSPDEISAMRPFFGELEALLREAQGTPP